MLTQGMKGAAAGGPKRPSAREGLKGARRRGAGVRREGEQADSNGYEQTSFGKTHDRHHSSRHTRLSHQESLALHATVVARQASEDSPASRRIFSRSAGAM